MDFAQDILAQDPEADWELEAVIGKGSYGSVHRARLRRLAGTAAERVAAVKKIALEDDAEISGLSADVVREVEALKACAHPAVISYLGAYIHAKCLWMVTELCEGGSILDVIRTRNAPLGDSQVHAVAACALAALRYLHDVLRITHRDIKAANLLLTSTGHVKLADFGVSVKLTNALATRSTAIGTPHWSARRHTAIASHSTHAPAGRSQISFRQWRPR